MVILITGGAGYIGAHVAKQLLESSNEELVVLDVVPSTHPTVEGLQQIRPFVYRPLHLSDWTALNELFQEFAFTAVLHFAAYLSVPESTKKPCWYYLNNTANTTWLIHCCLSFDVPKFIFSSTAAVYGEVGTEPVCEDHPTKPINPYGASKLMSETILRDTAKATKLKCVIFRYFNVAGADTREIDPSLAPRFGPKDQSQHLIKLAAECACGIREQLTICGTDFDTPDGTGVRDYIHVDDLANAHVLALSYLDNDDVKSEIFNVGYGCGYSVKEVVSTMKLVTGIDFPVVHGDRRPGDPAAVVANSDKIRALMGWKPKYNDLEMICHRSYLWERQRQQRQEAKN